jgi:hypothetical protein
MRYFATKAAILRDFYSRGNCRYLLSVMNASIGLITTEKPLKKASLDT